MSKSPALREIDDLMDELELLLKRGDTVAALSDAGINVSLAIVAANGLRAYFAGKKAEAAEDLTTVGEEIFARLRGHDADLPS
jgi:predicted ABC-type transport system involved in lysophospholipase L1 biosynthesis ATPase subunit